MAEMRTAEAPKKKAEKRHIHALRIELGKKGGHVVTHEMRGGGPEFYGGGEEEKPHIFGAEDGEKLLAHITKHAKIKVKPGEEEGMEDEKDSPAKANAKHAEREKAHDNESEEDTEENKEGESEGDKAER